MPFKSDNQRKAVMSKLSLWQKAKMLPKRYERCREHKIETDIKDTEKKLTEEQKLVEKRLALEKRMALLRSEQEELARLKKARFESSTLGHAWSNIKTGAGKAVEYTQRATEAVSREERPRRRNTRKRDDDDGEMLFGVD